MELPKWNSHHDHEKWPAQAVDSLLARKQASRDHERKLRMKCVEKKMTKAIADSLELIVSVVNNSQRISLA